MNQKQQQLQDQILLAAAQTVEKALDEQLDKFDVTDIEAVRAKRLKELREREQKKATWLANGHGRMNDVVEPKEFFDSVKKSNKVIAFFYRNPSKYSDILHQHLQKLAKTHIETKFFRIDADKANFLVDFLKIWMIPSVVLILNGNSDHTIQGLDELGSNFTTATLEKLLIKYKVLDKIEVESETDVKRRIRSNPDEFSDEDDY